MGKAVITKRYYENAELDYGPIRPPSETTLSLMQAEGWTLVERESSIWSVLSSQALSGIYFPLSKITDMFDTMLTKPVIDIMKR